MKLKETTIFRSIGIVLLVALIIGAGAALETKTFPSGTTVIPMDDHQADRWHSFGFVHMLLEEGVTIYRIIEPPDATLTTAAEPGGDTFAGGPILVMDPIPPEVPAAFPQVTLDTLAADFTSDAVFRAKDPTKILLLTGIWGHTDYVLDDMGIPFTEKSLAELEADPGMLEDYNLLIVDCPGWSALYTHSLPDVIRDAIEAFAENGNEVIFTDIALDNLDAIFPGYAPIVDNSGGTWPFDVINVGEFPSQYYGPSQVQMYTMIGGRIASAVLNPEVRIILKSDNYGPGEYRIGAFYFPFEKGIVEGFAYHPGDQSIEEAKLFGAILYGNKFIHAPPPPVVNVLVDIKPGSCPNAFNAGEKGVVSVAVLGSEKFDVKTIDPATVQLNGITPLRWSYEYAATPPPETGTCVCTKETYDGYKDLVLKFSAQSIAAELGTYQVKRDPVALSLTGKLLDGTTDVLGSDCVWVVK